MPPTSPLVCVAGPIGAGKSTLVSALATELGYQALLERADENPYLARYYEEPGRWAFHNLLFFLEQSISDQRYVRARRIAAVQERLPQEHLEVFGKSFHAQGFLLDDDVKLADRLAAAAMAPLKPPDLLIYVEVDSATALLRTGRRGRAVEFGISPEYLDAVATRYEQFIETWTLCPVLRVDSTTCDFRVPSRVRLVAKDVLRLLMRSEARPNVH